MCWFIRITTHGHFLSHHWLLHWVHTWQNIQALFREDFLEGARKANRSFNHQAIALRKWNHHIFIFFFLPPYSNAMFTRCKIRSADMLPRSKQTCWSLKSNSHFRDERFISKSSLPCHFQDCLATGGIFFFKLLRGAVICFLSLCSCCCWILFQINQGSQTSFVSNLMPSFSLLGCNFYSQMLF